MEVMTRYIEGVKSLLDEVLSTQSGNMLKAAEAIKTAAMGDRSVFAFGCSHAGLLALELYYRTGGMAIINPVRAPGLSCDVDPATMTSQMERMDGYGRIIIENQPIGPGDVIIIHSVSGRNAVTVDAAMRAKELGATVIAVTSMKYTLSQSSRHKSGKRLFECADIVIDNCGEPGDSSIEIEGVPEKVAPTSTAVGASIVNAVMAQAVELITRAGGTAPVFMSANIEGGDEHNRQMLKKYGKHIFYMGFGRE